MMVKKFIFLLTFVFGNLAVYGSELFLETERFCNLGGWVVDQQFMDQMGSPYIMAHGLGQPVADASTTFEVAESRTYYIYVRTYNWTSPWTPKEGPGKFVILVNGKRMPKVVGACGNCWEWQLAGKVKLRSGRNTLALHDLTGFNGRCDAVYMTTEPLNVSEVSTLRRTQELRSRLNPPVVHATKEFDFVVVGGGVAGMCAAVSAARLGCSVALVNDRPLWGGNNSSEVRVHLGGVIEIEPNKGLGRMIREFGHSQKGNAQPASYYEDAKKDSFLRAEPNIMLFASCHLTEARTEGGQIREVVVQQVNTGERYILRAPLFSDCTGDGTLGFLAGADYRMGREAKSEYGETFAPDTADAMVQGASCQWYTRLAARPSTFPNFFYGVEFNDSNCERVLKGEWTWETGMNRNQIAEAERIRDYALLVIYSNWSYLKNHDADKKKYGNYVLDWVGYILGKRESRRLMGDYVLSSQDIDKNMYHEDGSFTSSWAIDVHFVDSLNSTHFPGNEFKSRTIHRWIHPYAVPYRCLYSRNVNNLFMAGRDISCTHIALGTVRVMRTTGMMGEVVGMAASLCHKHNVFPRDIYRSHLSELKTLMRAGVGRTNVPDNQRFNEPNQMLETPRAFLK